MSDVHNRTRYLAGCRCDQCKRAQSEYRKGLRRRNNAQVAEGPVQHPFSTVTAMPGRPAATPEPPTLGPVEAGVVAEIGELTTAATRQGLVQMAYALARVLDNSEALPQHSAAAHRLSETLDKLRKGSENRTSRLASVRQMTRPAQSGEATG